MPVPAEVIPSVGYATAPTDVRIQGKGFLLRPVQPSGGGEPTLDMSQKAWLDDTPLADVTWVSSTELTGTIPPGLAVGPHALTVENALGERGRLEAAFTVLARPELSATLATARQRVNVNQDVTVTLTVANTGSLEVIDFAVSDPVVTASGGARVRRIDGPTPAPPAVFAAGASQEFQWTYRSSSAGRASFAVSASGTDPLTGQALEASPTAPVEVIVERAAALAVSTTAPPSVAIGQDFAVSTTVTNSGGAQANSVAPAAPSVAPGGTGSAKVKAGPSPSTATLPGGQSATFTWTFTAEAAGTFQLRGSATGQDANSGAAVSSAAGASGNVQAGDAAVLETVKSAPASAATGQAFPVVIQFANPGTKDVISFGVLPPSAAPASLGASCTGPAPATPTTLAAGQSVDLTWSCTATSAGDLSLAFAGGGYHLTGQPFPQWFARVDGLATAQVNVAQ